MKFNFVSYFSIALLTSACATESRSPSSNQISAPVDLSDNSSAVFIEHSGKGPMDSYLAMNISYPPIVKIRDQTLGQISTPLKNRGEAHITVITPPEFNALRSLVSIDEIDDLAQEMKIQETAIAPICVGKGEAQLQTQVERVYFVVVQAPGLLKIRQKIRDLFVARGGDAKAFPAEVYYPHITLGFTKRDLFEADGVIKDIKSCIINFRPN